MPNETQPQTTNGAAPEPAAIVVNPPQHTGDALSPFSASAGGFEVAQRMAKALASSSLVPQTYRNDVPNCLIAMELASRIGVSVLAAMQNLHVIQGKPSWSSSFLIATVNASGRFTPLRFEWAGDPGKDSWACRAHAKDRSTGDLCVGPWITWAMAGKEGWTTKAGSKWKTMPELMFHYRAAAFWTRVFCPELSIGFQTAEEAADIHGAQAVEATAMPAELSPGGAAGLSAVLGLNREAEQAPSAEVAAEVIEQKPAEPAHDPETGELFETKAKKGK